MPGPRDHSGLPDSIRFWQSRVEETNPLDTFPVGLIYGPSGCGKSSLVKAGLLPRLSEHVITIYIEATAWETEQRLLHCLGRHCGSDDYATLPETLAAVRRGIGIPAGSKLLIVFDQFEQWLHAHEDPSNTDLVRALRQCDGGRVQCLVMVRDDFWLAATRFMDELEIDLRQGHNSAMVDLFNPDHARKVLATLGRAFGRLPDRPEDMSKQQQAFLSQAVSELEDDGRISCVRLALFADMVKGKSWTPDTLKRAGGSQGVGVMFLEETFSARTSHPKHRLHQHAARAVLKALLPEAGSDIRGQTRSYADLIEASGYARRPREFDDLLQMLDSELRLITPVEHVAGDTGRVDEDAATDGEAARAWRSDETAEQATASTPTAHDPPPAPRHYQLTHDYLVSSLRNWLTLKQRETRLGRAELKLDEQTAWWNHKPEIRHLPSLWDTLRIMAFTKRADWSKPQAEMMRTAMRLHGIRWACGVLMTLAIAAGGMQWFSQQMYLATLKQTSTLVDGLADSGGRVVPLAIRDLEELPRDIVIAELRSRYQANQQPFLAYALAELGGEADVKIDYLVSQIESAQHDEVDNLVAALGHARERSLKAINEVAAEAEWQHQWKLKARLAMVALHLEHPDLAADMCMLRRDQVQRSAFIKECATWHGELQELVKVVPIVKDAALRSALCLGIGSVEFEMEQAWTRVFKEWFRTERDTGTHSAAGWALRKWDEDLPEIERSLEPGLDLDWYVNTRGMTMLRIPKGTVTYQSMEGQQVDVTADDDFWLADREISIGQYEQFVNDDAYPPAARPMNWRRDTRYGQAVCSDDHPVTNVILNDAVLFCNWLSKQEDRQPCYRFTGKVVTSFPGGDARHSHGDFKVWELDQTADGYRLPLKAEWEYARRAGTTTEFSHGSDLGLLSDYVVYRSRIPRKCGSKLPNGWGLFDMHGNTSEWCNTPQPTGAGVLPVTIPGSLCGGNCYFTKEMLAAYGTSPFGPVVQGDRSFMTNYDGALPMISFYGFRVARNADLLRHPIVHVVGE